MPRVIKNILLATYALSNDNAPLKEWLPLAKDETSWHRYIDEYFDSCRKVEECDDGSVEEERNESILGDASQKSKN
jgi:hypothetical protein